ncbi:hypothetical protein LOTGIDRAFT_162920 [Lottia gigantea]|uniref:EF-hand domain-containing protein n=1 Tax=Lottia gigantea TaxID=225164 RepID=V3ZLN8_LOTGI|nr:hypothetical protein LOTGIDRAFT_162920 [Lottia gigantea]ESO92268.1 hypothetical protein LOTGIDRAFT_162920 [Lottia gigantea]
MKLFMLRVIILCVIVILNTGVNSEIDSTDQSTLQDVGSEDIESEILESIETIKDLFTGIIETSVNNSVSQSDFIMSLFPELEEFDLQDKDVDLIKEDLNKLSEKARELGGLLDKNALISDCSLELGGLLDKNALISDCSLELGGLLDKNKDGQITMDEVQHLDPDGKVDKILRVIVKIQKNIDSQFEGEDEGLFEEYIFPSEKPVAQDPDLIDLDEDFIEPREDVIDLPEDVLDIHDEL